jgi:uncharacterized protein DUF3617
MNARQRPIPRVCAAAVLLVGLAAAMPASAQAKDDLWEVSTKMEMPGMPMAIPSQTNRVCVGKNRKDEDFIPRMGDCRMVDSKRVGNKFSYRMECTGDHAGTIEGAISFGNNAYDGQMRMTMKGSSDAMTTTFSGRRVGDCTAGK